MFRGVAVWVVIMLAETLHGIVRQALVVPHFGPEVAEQIGWPAGLAIVLGIATALSRWTGLQNTASLIRLGLIWAMMTLAFETFIGLLRGYDWQQIGEAINPASGGLMLYSLVAMAAAPTLASRLSIFLSRS